MYLCGLCWGIRVGTDIVHPCREGGGGGVGAGLYRAMGPAVHGGCLSVCVGCADNDHIELAHSTGYRGVHLLHVAWLLYQEREQ